MPPGRPPTTWRSALESFIRSKKRVKAKTIQKYRWYYNSFFTALEKAGLETLPQKIGETEINYLLNETWAEKDVSTREYYVKILNMFLLKFGNDIVKEMGIRFPTDSRINVDWLSTTEQVMLLEADLTPLQELVIHLELCVGLRRIEIIRLDMADVHEGYFDVRGKGEDQGKWRTVPFHPNTQKVLDRWYQERDAMVASAREYSPNIEVPDALVIYKAYIKKPRLGRYSENGDALDDQVKIKVREDVGFHFGNHTLRRTCGRTIWQAAKAAKKEVPLETISRIYGHSDTSTTLDYIGINLDDMSEAMGILAAFQNQMRGLEDVIASPEADLLSQILETLNELRNERKEIMEEINNE